MGGQSDDEYQGLNPRTENCPPDTFLSLPVPEPKTIVQGLVALGFVT